VRALVTLALKDLRRRLADPAGLLINMAIPLAIAGMMALAFGGSSTGSSGRQSSPVLRLVLVDEDDTPVSDLLAGSSQNKEAAERLSVLRAQTREAGLELMREKEAAAMFIIPKGFSEALLDGVPARLELVRNPAQSVMPEVASQGAGVVALYLTVGRRFLGDDAQRLRALIEGKGWEDTAGLALSLASLYQRIKASDDLLFPPLITLGEAQREEEGGGGFQLMGWMYPGLLVMGLLFVSVTQMRDLLRERDAGTLRRQLCAPLGTGTLLAAKVLSVALTVLAAHAILLAAGSLAFGLSWGPPLALAVVSALLVLAVTGFAALLFSLVRTERQGDAVASIGIMVMSLLGGAFIPPQIMPEALQAASRATLNHWGQGALRALSAGEGWQGARPFLGALAGLALVFTLAGVALLRWRHVRGAL
jgi:ABC-2 type transport system permease protein